MQLVWKPQWPIPKCTTAEVESQHLRQHTRRAFQSCTGCNGPNMASRTAGGSRTSRRSQEKQDALKSLKNVRSHSCYVFFCTFADCKESEGKLEWLVSLTQCRVHLKNDQHIADPKRVRKQFKSLARADQDESPYKFQFPPLPPPQSMQHNASKCVSRTMILWGTLHANGDSVARV